MKLTRLVGQANSHRSAPVIPPQRPPVIPPQRPPVIPNVISSEAEKSKPAVGSRGTYGSAALALNPSLSRLSGAGRNPGERGDARMKESTDETNPLSRPGLPPQRPPVIPPQRPNVISSEAEKSKPAVGSRGPYPGGAPWRNDASTGGEESPQTARLSERASPHFDPGLTRLAGGFARNQ